MPPKREGTGGGGGSDTPASTEQPPQAPPSEEDAKPNVDQLNADAVAASSEAELPSDPITSQQQQQQQDPISVNSTPAPSARSTPSVQQVDTPNRATPTASTSRGKRPTAPRGAGRRSQAQREALQKAEDERRQQEAKERAKQDASKSKAGRGRGRGRGDSRGSRGRGRGGYVGDFSRENRESVASGPFSAGEIAKDKRKSGWRPSFGISRGSQKGYSYSGREPGEASAGASGAGDSGTFTTGIAPKKPSGPRQTIIGGYSRSRTADGTPVKADPDRKPATDADGDVPMLGQTNGGYISSDDEDGKEDTQGYNIENLIDLTRDDDGHDSMAPVRVTRVAHKERTMGINADGATNKEGKIDVGANDASSTAKRKGKQKAKEAPQPQEISSGSDREPELFEPVEQPTIKPDPEAPSAAEERIPESQMVGGATPADGLPHDPPSSPESKRKAKDKIKAASSQPERPDLQTQEEIDEWDRNQSDLRNLRAEFGTPAPTPNADGDFTEADPRADKVYLFQFPPVLPDLAPLAIKPDPDAPPQDSNAMDIDTATSGKKKNDKDNPIDVGENSATGNQPNLPSGMVGKLNIHKSGRATLDWGGTSFCLGMGASASFLQDCLMFDVPEKEEGGGRGEEAAALSMGQVKGKFVVTPDWDEILG